MNIKSSIKDYKIIFGGSLNDHLLQQVKMGDIIIIDKKVYNTLETRILTLINKNINIKINALEKTKSYDGVKPIIKKIIKFNFRKNNKLICIGGGITQDITAFISSILYRGVNWIFFPTTLLSQGDSCIGGKTSINIESYKNQLGNFYPPSKIFILPFFLKSLSNIDFKSGMGEMLHFHLVSNIKDFNFYKKHYQETLDNEESVLKLIKRTLKIKQKFVEKDEFDRGERLLLNYGHSFGHAIESITNYKIPHGIAVSFGMDLANFISVKLNFMTMIERNIIKKQLSYICKDVRLPKINVDEFAKTLLHDKKNIGGKYRFILSKGIGKMFIKEISPSSSFKKYLNQYFKS
jgi:3-dehydroquinate synthase